MITAGRVALLAYVASGGGNEDHVGTDTGSGVEGTIVLTVTISATGDTSSGADAIAALAAAIGGSDIGAGGDSGTPFTGVAADANNLVFDISYHNDFIAARDIQVRDTGTGLDVAVVGFLVRILTDTDTGIGYNDAHRNASGRGLSFLALRTRPDVADEWQVPDLP